MPPKHRRAPVKNRSDETQRLSGGEALPFLAAASARRPHHLVSRLYPPWGSGSNEAVHRTSGGTRNTTTTTTKDGASGSAAVASVMMPNRASTKEPNDTAYAPRGRGRAGLPTRVSSNGREKTRPTGVATSSRRTDDRRASAARKRPRSTSTSSFPVPVEVEKRVADSNDDSGVEAVHNSSDGSQRTEAVPCTTEIPPDATQLSTSPSPSLSPLPMLAERRVLKGGDPGGGGAAGEDASHAVEWQRHRLPGVQDPSPSASATATAEEVVLSPVRLSDVVTPQKPPLPCTAVSTVDSKVLFAEEEDEEEEDEERQAWRLNLLNGTSGDTRRLARAQDEIHVLGELSENSSITSARPQALRRSLDASGGGGDDRVPPAGREVTGRDTELRGEPLGVRRIDTTADSGANTVFSDEDDEDDGEARRRTHITYTTPSLQSPSADVGEGGPIPVLEGCTPGAAGAAATLAETLAVQDLSLLPDENGGGATVAVGGVVHSDSCGYTPLLSSSTGQHTPHSAITNEMVLPQLRGGTPGAAAAEEVLLGEGFISPPVKRVTATPQQATQRIGMTTEDGTATRSGAAKAAADASRVHENALSIGGSTSSMTFLPTLPSATPCAVTGIGGENGLRPRVNMPLSYSSADAAASETAEQSAPPPMSRTPSSPSLPPSSLPSTLDDGLWKESAGTTQLDVVDGIAVNSDCSPPHLQLRRRDAPAPLALSVAVAPQEMVPIDPFLSTPPQFKQRSSVRTKDTSGGGGGRMRCVPQPSARRGASKDGHSPATPDFPSHFSLLPTKQSATSDPPTVTGAEVDVQVLRVGTRVEGRWGRQWFPAVISEAPRNGFVQIEWEEDGSLLHVRLREVRLLPGATTAWRASAVSASRESNWNAASVGEAAATEDGHDVLTGTQLVALMDAEDAEESRHEPMPPHIRLSAPCREASPPMTTPTNRQLERSAGKAAERAEEDVAVSALCVGYTHGATRHGADAVSADGIGHSDLGRSAAPSACTANSGSPSRSPAATSRALSPSPGEAHPSSLCIFLPQTVRRDLLQGEGLPPALTSSSPFRYRAGPATELQRRTELQRILHFLTSAGTVLVDSVAQADNIAAQLGDSGEVNATRFTRHPSPLAAEQSHSADSPLMHVSKTASGVIGSGVKRKAVGRVSLPQRSAMSAVAVTSHAQCSAPKYFIFLVSSAAAIVSDLAEGTERPNRQHGMLSEVCLAHALGVSAIHASWLWSITPGTTRVKLPTPADQVELLPRAGPEKWTARRDTGTCALSTKALPLPLRFAPLAVKDRWLSAKDVAFVVRDDRMEMWLNVAGATVTAEPAPAPSFDVARESLSRGSSRVSALPCCSSGSPLHSPPLRQSHAERMPDFVYVPDDATVPVDLDRLGSVPVLKVPWLADGIEQHYRHCCNPASTAESVLPTPPLLSSVWGAIPYAKPPKESHVRHRTMLLQSDCMQSSPSSPSVKPRVNEAEGSSRPNGARSNEVAAALTLANERNCPSQYGGDAMPPELVPQLADCREGSADGAAPSAAPPSTSGGSADEGVGDAVGEVRGSVSEEEVLTPRISSGDVQERPPSREAKGLANAGGSSGTAEEKRVDAEVEDDIIPRGVASTRATAAILPGAVAPTEPSVCTSHPGIAIGEDYYFTFSAPPPPSSPSPPPHGPPLSSFPLPGLPTATIVLGRVLDLQADAPPSSLLHQHLWAGGAASSLSFSQSQCRCRVTLQLYEPKYVSMHVDPRSGEVVHQTTVCLAQRWLTVPGTSLLYDTAVYVITRAARQHVYYLEEEEGEVTAPAIGDSAYYSHRQQRSVLCAVSAPPTSDPSHSATRTTTETTSPPDFYERRSLSKVALTSSSPVPACSATRWCRPTAPPPGALTSTPPVVDECRHWDALASSGTSEGATRGGSDGVINKRRQRDWALQAAEAMRRTPVSSVLQSPDRGVSAQRESTQRTPEGRASADVSEPQRLTQSTVLGGSGPASRSPAFDLAELGQPPSSVAIAAVGSTSSSLKGCPARQSLQRRVTLGNSPRPVQLITELPLHLGNNTVVLRPNSHISFYPDSSLSFSEHLPGCRSLAAGRDSGLQSHSGNKEDRRGLRQPTLINTARVAERTTGEPVYRNGDGDGPAGSDTKSDTSEEIVVEAPLIGRVELMREVEGVIDIVVHTPQPNSVFGGSRMYRITPGMIVDASP
ncbi:conserved hypothetical protein [Leishmania braziliensis MHOM/BR/75/M2904]|uniref:Uncharacterized protein n=1 Tax=Leishmania braziliensis TaxID=5660 RepID=A4HI84_LEIBR|nr:conserved hypothetical protein [Leishmania braziliensis MHOM/BR/75/M2904]CAJ2477143.1 unnamed protein product [Leishmania braziliensis]CAM40293.1 conserved hypothetical protein [Leishmania braziliensis MHOM/BR/75/M2904]